MGRRPRWDIDERGTGVADAAPMLADVQRLAAAMREPGWVAEEAYAHLGRHLRAACAGDGADFRWIGDEQVTDGVYVVELGARDARPGSRMRDVVRLVASIAESSFAVRQVDAATYDCVTGILPGDGDFAPHGHTVRVVVRA